MDQAQFVTRLDESAAAVNALLNELLTQKPAGQEILRPARLVEAARYAVLGGGKRIRPFLLIETAALFGVTGIGPLRAAAAVECLHGYSLVHDDLPAMDDDDLRRGKPTVHKAFDEATAILVGDGLQALAFDILASAQTHSDPAIRAEMVRMLARASGFGGMVGGQMMDLQAEKQPLNSDELLQMQSMKTGCLFRFACEAGALIAQAPAEDQAAMARFGAGIGTAFQLADDLLDVTASTAAMGKRTAKDAHRGKATQVAREGIDAAKSTANQILDSALAELPRIDADTTLLEAAARYMVERAN